MVTAMVAMEEATAAVAGAPSAKSARTRGHEASKCRYRYDDNSRSGNTTSTSSNNPPHWIMDSGATDHPTSDLERLLMHERYGGTNQVQVANGAGCLFRILVIRI
jgi:hypothetical protein